MTKISIYPLDSSITKSDKLIGTDGDDNSVTKNFAVDAFAEYVKSEIIPYSTFSFFIDMNDEGVITVIEHMNDTGLTFTFSEVGGYIDMTASSSIANSKASFISTCINNDERGIGTVSLLQPRYLGTVSRLLPVTSDGSFANVISAYVEFKIYN